MTKALGLVLLFIGMSSLALAQVAPVPEIDAGAAASALCLLSGAILVIRGRKK